MGKIAYNSTIRKFDKIISPEQGAESKVNKMTNFYYVVTTKEEINGKEKLYSYMLKVHESNNLLAVINGIKDLHILHQCKTKKQAEELTRKWNNSYKHNGTYLFENEPCF